MVVRDTRHVLDRQNWLEPTSDVVQRAVTRTLTRTPRQRLVDSFLNGTWAGHPLHPIVTDIPVGAWTMAALFDAIGTGNRRQRFAPAADVCIVAGLLGAVGSAVTGLAQWQYTDAESRREGMAHALLNTGATMLYGASALLRARGQRGAGKVFAALGFGVVIVSSYLGGDLVYNYRVGVNHAPGQQLPETWVPVAAEADLAEGEAKALDVGDVRMMLVRHNGSIYAMARECSHLGGPLEEGQFANGCVTCPWHASIFSLEDGRVIAGPATFPQPVYESRVRNGQIEVRAQRETLEPVFGPE